MERILFFDGVCVMCNGLIDFVIKHDQKKIFKFASLQGETAKALIPEYSGAELTTVVLKEAEETFTESDAIIRLLMGLGGIYKLASVFRVIPKGIRNSIYRYIAKNRYRWFGKREMCRLPSPEERERILD